MSKEKDKRLKKIGLSLLWIGAIIGIGVVYYKGSNEVSVDNSKVPDTPEQPKPRENKNYHTGSKPRRGRNNMNRSYDKSFR